MVGECVAPPHVDVIWNNPSDKEMKVQLNNQFHNDTEGRSSANRLRDKLAKDIWDQGVRFTTEEMEASFIKTHY